MNALLLDRYLAFIISIIRIVYVIGVGSDAARARFVILSTEHATVTTNGSGAPTSLVRLGPGIAASKQPTSSPHAGYICTAVASRKA